MAVHTQVAKSEILAHLQNYQIGSLLDFEGIVEGIDNSNFILKTSEGKFIFTIFESRINLEELPFFINLKLYLAKNGICCPRPILDNKGLAIVDFKNKKSSIVTFLSGKTLKPRADGYYDNIKPNHCFELGKALAQTHLAAADFSMKRKNDLGVGGFLPLFTKFEHLLEDYQKGLKEEILQNINFLNSSWKSDLPEAAVHADLFPDNVFFDEKNRVSGIIDFYFAANDALVYDFAICVNAWCFDENNNFLQKNFDELLRGYEEVRKFNLAEKDFLKIALPAASMRFLLTRLHDMFFTPKTSVIRIKNPQEYLAKLRFFNSKL